MNAFLAVLCILLGFACDYFIFTDTNFITHGQLYIAGFCYASLAIFIFTFTFFNYESPTSYIISFLLGCITTVAAIDLLYLTTNFNDVLQILTYGNIINLSKLYTVLEIVAILHTTIRIFQRPLLNEFYTIVCNYINNARNSISSNKFGVFSK